MYRTVLVPLDGSAFAEHALPLALSIARRAGATLRLVRVHVPLATAYGGNELATDLDPDTTVKAAEHAYLEDVSARLGKVCSILQATALLDGRIADALCEQALSCDAALLVMATHGRGPLSRFWLGSVADELVRRVSRPLLLVRPDETAPDLAQAPEVRAVCGSAARTDPRGGLEATPIPTATAVPATPAAAVR
jgi:nucleotide-binding universal stress UspA family protein